MDYTLKQPFDTITKLGFYFRDKEIDWAISGSWALVLTGVALPDGPHDLDVQVGIENPSMVYDDNPWIQRMYPDNDTRAVVVEDEYPVDLWDVRHDFPREALGRAKPISWGGLTLKLLNPIDIHLLKFGRPQHDPFGEATCNAINRWVYKLKPIAGLEGGEVRWCGPVRLPAR